MVGVHFPKLRPLLPIARPGWAAPPMAVLKASAAAWPCFPAGEGLLEEFGGLGAG